MASRKKTGRSKVKANNRMKAERRIADIKAKADDKKFDTVKDAYVTMLGELYGDTMNDETKNGIASNLASAYINGYSVGYEMGWNDCGAKMLGNFISMFDDSVKTNDNADIYNDEEIDVDADHAVDTADTYGADTNGNDITTI